ncbi:MAG: 4-hydroxy-tetrahydrodipicolinate synthase [Bdellovibrio sp.]
MNINETILWTAIVTPMNADGSLNFKDLEKLLREQKEAGNGVVLLGSTGESLNLSEKERRDLLTFALGLKLDIPTMVGVGGVHMEETTAWVEYLNSLKGIDCYLLVTPLYAKPGRRGQTAWFKKLMDTSTRPCMLYNVPSRTGKAMDHNTVVDLKDHKNFWAIKEASGSEAEFAKYRSEAPKNALLMSGDDALTPAFCRLGGNGLVSVASNIWPKETNLFVQKSLNKTLSKQEEQLWSECANALFIASNPIPAKVLLKELGRISSSTLKLPLTHLDLEDPAPLLSAHSKIQEWYKSQK